MQKELWPTEAERLRDEGIKKAVNHADHSYLLSWSERAYDYLVSFTGENKGFSVLAEEIRVYAEEPGMAPPPSKWVWGGLMRRAAGSNLVVKVGYCKTCNPLAHCTPATLWEIV